MSTVTCIIVIEQVTVIMHIIFNYMKNDSVRNKKLEYERRKNKDLEMLDYYIKPKTILFLKKKRLGIWRKSQNKYLHQKLHKKATNKNTSTAMAR